MPSRSGWRPRGCATCGASAIGAKKDGTRGSRDARPRASGSTRWTDGSRPRPTSAPGRSGPCRRPRRRSSRRRSAKSAAELELRRAVELESEARQAVAAQTNRGVRMAALEEDLRRLEARFAETAEELEGRGHELEAAESAFASAADARRDAEDERRRLAEEAAAHRAEMETFRRSLASYDRERSRLEDRSGRSGSAGRPARREREALAADVERLDASTAPLGDRRSELERERHGLSDTVAELEEGLRRLELRRDVLRARLDDLERTPGSRFLEEHAGRGVGLLGQLIRAVDGWDRALRAGLGSLADAVVYEDAERALADAPTGEGATLAVAGGGPAAFELSGRADAAFDRRRGPDRAGPRVDPPEGHLPGRDPRGGGRQARRAPEGFVRHARRCARRARPDPHDADRRLPRRGGAPGARRRRARPGEVDRRR